VYVSVDEAHRTTGGDLGNYLMGALPNATYLGFTGTPIDQTAYGKGTFKVFGANDEKGYLDKYSIKESVQDGTTVPLHYQLAPNELLVDRETLEKEFLELADAEGVSDIEELNKVLDRAVTLKNMLKNEERVDKLAKFVAEHYLSTIEPMGYKAFLVAVDREGCAMLKDAIDKYLPPEYSEVVMSSAGKKDSEKLRKYQLSEDEEKAIRKRFRKPEEQPKILIVTEKLLTGFDAPVLYCMYLDKPMRDHVLLQAIARVNRPYEDEDGRRKPCGFVLDFVGIFEKLEKALAFDSKDVEGVIEGLDVLKTRFEQQIDVGRQKYLQIPKGRKGDKAVEVVLEYFRDKEPREDFYSFFRELDELHEIISPDQFMRPFIDDFTELASMYELVRGCYDRGISVDKEFMRKTAKLVRKHTQTSGIGEPTKLQKLNAEMLQAIADGDEPDTVKVFNLLKAIDQLTREEANKEPYLLSIGEKAEQIAAAFEDRQQNTKDTLSGLEKLIQEYMEARKQREATELSPESFAVFWLLKQQGVEKADDVAKAAAEAFEQNPHWQSSSHQEQEVRKSFYKALITAEVDGVVEVAQNILKMLKGVGK
jgi:type I restriction enzyme R subunit